MPSSVFEPGDWVKVRAVNQDGGQDWSLFPYEVAEVRHGRDGTDTRIVVRRMGGLEQLVVGPDQVQRYHLGHMING